MTGVDIQMNDPVLPTPGGTLGHARWLKPRHQADQRTVRLLRALGKAARAAGARARK